MKSNPDSSPPLGEIALTVADSEAMRRSAADARILSSEEYLRFLENVSAHVEPSRATSAGWLAFDLRDAAIASAAGTRL